MRYEIKHRTSYAYDEPVSIGHHLARLAPRDLPGQRREAHALEIEPVPSSMAEHLDYFGNATLFFVLRGSHRTFSVTARSVVEMNPQPVPATAETPPWETLRDAARADVLTPDAEAGEYVFASPLVIPGTLFAEYA